MEWNEPVHSGILLLPPVGISLLKVIKLQYHIIILGPKQITYYFVAEDLATKALSPIQSQQIRNSEVRNLRHSYRLEKVDPHTHNNAGELHQNFVEQRHEFHYKHEIVAMRPRIWHVGRANEARVVGRIAVGRLSRRHVQNHQRGGGQRAVLLVERGRLYREDSPVAGVDSLRPRRAEVYSSADDQRDPAAEFNR